MLWPQDIRIPETYPFQPVKMKFITKVYHPNVSSASGAICLDILKVRFPPCGVPSLTTELHPMNTHSLTPSTGRLVPRPHAQVDLDIAAEPAVLPRAERPAGRGGRETLHDLEAELRRDGGVLDAHLRGRAAAEGEGGRGGRHRDGGARSGAREEVRGDGVHERRGGEWVVSFWAWMWW